MTTIYVEAQRDSARGTVTLAASSGYGEQPYVVTAPAASESEAMAVAWEFIDLYRKGGATVVTDRAVLPPIEGAT